MRLPPPISKNSPRNALTEADSKHWTANSRKLQTKVEYWEYKDQFTDLLIYVSCPIASM